VGSSSDNKPPEGLAERIAGDPTATREPSGWFGGEVGVAVESPADGWTAGLVEAGSGEAISGVIVKEATLVTALVAMVERSVADWRLIHN